MACTITAPPKLRNLRVRISFYVFFFNFFFSCRTGPLSLTQYYHTQQRQQRFHQTHSKGLCPMVLQPPTVRASTRHHKGILMMKKAATPSVTDGLPIPFKHLACLWSHSGQKITWYETFLECLDDIILKSKMQTIT